MSAQIAPVAAAELPLFVRDLSGETTRMVMRESDTLAALRAHVSLQFELPVTDVVLLRDGVVLVDEGASLAAAASDDGTARSLGLAAGTVLVAAAGSDRVLAAAHPGLVVPLEPAAAAATL